MAAKLKARKAESRAVIPEVREEVARLYLGREASEKHWMMFERLMLFNSFLDKDENGESTGRLVVTHEMLHEVCGANARLKDELDEFSKATGTELNAKFGYSYKGKATTITLQLDPSLVDALAENAKAPVEARTVYFATGTRVPVRQLRKSRKRHDGKAKEALPDNCTAETRELLNYLNEAHPERVIELIGNGVKAVAELLPEMPFGLQKQYVVGIANGIAYQPRPHYVPKDKTSRVFAIGAPINCLPRAFRKYACAASSTSGGKVCELDLAQAHLAINATLWHLPKTTAMLNRPMESQGGFWKQLLNELGLGLEFKALVKTCIYAITYGCGEANVRARFLEGEDTLKESIEGTHDENLWMRFRNHPIIAELFDGSKKAIRKVSREKGGHGADGQWVANYEDDKFDALSTLAAITTSHEQKIMQSLLPVLKSYPKLYVISWLHDGITIVSGDDRRTDCILRKLCKAAKKTAQELGVPTKLEVTRLDINDCRREARAYMASLHGNQTGIIAA